MYSGIKSNFVKQELKKTKFKDRKYIDRLMDIEKFATTGYCSTGAGYIRHILKGKYPQQWEKIWMELNPKEYKEIFARERKQESQDRKEEEQWKREEREEFRMEKKDWKEMGGKIN